MKRELAISNGPDVVSIEIDEVGVTTTTWADGSHTATVAAQAITDAQRARSAAAHRFFKRKRRSWPIPRI